MSFERNRMEEEYFARKEFERRQKVEAEKQKQMQEAEKDRLKDLHHMHCPKCGMPLIEVDYKSVKIDKCSHCNGIWLDDSELDAILKLQESEASGLGRLLKAFK